MTNALTIATLGLISMTLSSPSTASAQDTPPATSALRVARIIGDGMVMQRGVAVPVWGWAAPGRAVTVTFDGRRYAARAAADGAWKVTLPKMSDDGGRPHELTVTDGTQRLTVRDIVVGDVWICSGQSNMEFAVAAARNASAEIAAANDPLIRHFKVPNSYAEHPEADLAGGAWEKADPQHVGTFTAVGYFFARDLRGHVKVPIGLINTSWGGSRIEPWMSAEALGFTPATLDSMLTRERDYERHATDAIRAKLGDTPPTVDAGLVDGRAVWADPALDESSWSTIATPGLWEEQGYEGMDGIAWYRTSFQLSDAEARAGGVRVGLGEIDDSDVSWVNGVEVGRMENAWNKVRVYDVPTSALRAGRNVIAVRVQDNGGGGGVYGAADDLFVEVGGARRPLAGTWKFRVGAVVLGPDAQHINKVPTLLYNKMVHPLLPYPIKGALWYQGESNGDDHANAAAYRPLFQTMIRDWRRRWNVGDFPFLWVQLANFMAVDSTPLLQSNWGTLRESQTAALALPHTAQAVTIDIGEGEDIHPKNKQDVGRRLALAARAVAYGDRTVVYSGPTYRRSTIAGGRVTVEFDHVGGGLTTRGAVSSGNGAAVHGFEIAGADRRFVWADARIEGGHVVVWSDKVPAPVAVRYAWADNPVQADLFNREGLPAAPFRSDAW